MIVFETGKLEVQMKFCEAAGMHFGFAQCDGNSTRGKHFPASSALRLRKV
jgi:hypothetical protein